LLIFWALPSTMFAVRPAGTVPAYAPALIQFG
jgi:hypothetical protein